MAKQDTGEKTEQPTQKKLRDARREGQVGKSKDLTHTAGTLAWALVLVTLSGWMAGRVAALLEETWIRIEHLSVEHLLAAGYASGKVLLILTIVPLALAAVVSSLAEFLQTGPILAPKKIAPKMSNIGLSEGFKRMFSVDNLFEVAKSIAKTAVLLVIVILIARASLDAMVLLPIADVMAYPRLTLQLLVRLFFWVIALFTVFSIIDWLYQKHSFLRKQRMSKYDVKKEHKDQDGDPNTRGERRSLHRQWATEGAGTAVRAAKALVVNPTHIAVAIAYEPGDIDVPLVCGKAEGPGALAMREVATQIGVPVLRNVMLARELHYRCEPDDVIPEDLFDTVAEVLVWADSLRAAAEPAAPEPFA